MSACRTPYRCLHHSSWPEPPKRPPDTAQAHGRARGRSLCPCARSSHFLRWIVVEDGHRIHNPRDDNGVFRGARPCVRAFASQVMPPLPASHEHGENAWLWNASARSSATKPPAPASSAIAQQRSQAPWFPPKLRSLPTSSSPASRRASATNATSRGLGPGSSAWERLEQQSTRPVGHCRRPAIR